VIYDIGAEEGDMPGLWASWGCKVVLIEPNPRVWPNMRAIWDANGFEMPLASFVGFASHTDSFNKVGNWLEGTGWFIGEWPPCAYGDVIGDHGFANLCERPDIPSITLNTIADTVGMPNAVTMDVEGSELCVLQGAAAIVLTEYRPRLWISVHEPFMADMYGHTPKMVYDMLDNHGYEWEILADDHETHVHAWPT
jgi:FkbM family methyltransferase